MPAARPPRRDSPRVTDRGAIVGPASCRPNSWRRCGRARCRSWLAIQIAPAAGRREESSPGPRLRRPARCQSCGTPAGRLHGYGVRPVRGTRRCRPGGRSPGWLMPRSRPSGSLDGGSSASAVSAAGPGAKERDDGREIAECARRRQHSIWISARAVRRGFDRRRASAVGEARFDFRQRGEDDVADHLQAAGADGVERVLRRCATGGSRGR